MKKNIKLIIDFVAWKDNFKKVINQTAASKLGDNNQFRAIHAALYNDLEKYYNIFIPQLNFKRGCNSCWMDRYFELTQISLKQIITIMNIKHKLKDGVVINYKGKFYSSKSPHFTNEIAEEIYKIRPSDFEYFDKNWRQKEITLPEFDKALTTATVEDFFKAVEVDTIDTIDTIEPKEKAAPKKRATKRKSKK